MKINTRFLLFLALLLTFASCKKDKTIGFDIGKNRFTTVVDGDDREYYVHVPESYGIAFRGHSAFAVVKLRVTMSNF